MFKDSPMQWIIIFILILIVFGSWFFFYKVQQKAKKPQPEPPAELLLLNSETTPAVPVGLDHTISVLLQENSKLKEIVQTENHLLKEALIKMETKVQHLNQNLSQEQQNLNVKQKEISNYIIENASSTLAKITSTTTNLEHFRQISENKQNAHLTELNKTFQKLEQNLTEIARLETKIDNLNGIFYNSKNRGNLGEFTLNTILSNILGENKKIWATQVVLSAKQNKSEKGAADAVIYLGNDAKIIIDSKFPLEPYQLVQQAISHKAPADAILKHKNDFKTNIKTKIKEVKKYVIPENNVNHGILFVPSEAVFAFIHDELSDVLDFSFKEKIWLCSPTTLAAVLTIIYQVEKDFQLNKNLVQIKKIIMSITEEYHRFHDRWLLVKKKIEDNRKEINDLDITVDKIFKKSDNLNTYDLSDDEAIRAS